MKFSNWIIGGILTLSLLTSLALWSPPHKKSIEQPVQVTLKLTTPPPANIKPRTVQKIVPMSMAHAPSSQKPFHTHPSSTPSPVPMTQAQLVEHDSIPVPDARDNLLPSASTIVATQKTPTYTESDLTFRPRLLSGKIPPYPEIYPRPNQPVCVTIRYQVSRFGIIKNIQIIKHNDPTPDHQFVKSIQIAMKSWRFPPGQVNNETVEYEVTKEFRFENPKG